MRLPDYGLQGFRVSWFGLFNGRTLILSSPRHSKLWWSKCQRDRFVCECCSILLSASCHQCFIHTHLSPLHPIILAVDSVVVEGTVGFSLTSLSLCCALGNKCQARYVLVSDISFSSQMSPKITLGLSHLSVCAVSCSVCP